MPRDIFLRIESTVTIVGYYIWTRILTGHMSDMHFTSSVPFTDSKRRRLFSFVHCISITENNLSTEWKYWIHFSCEWTVCNCHFDRSIPRISWDYRTGQNITYMNLFLQQTLDGRFYFFPWNYFKFHPFEIWELLERAESTCSDIPSIHHATSARRMRRLCILQLALPSVPAAIYLSYLRIWNCDFFPPGHCFWIGGFSVPPTVSRSICPVWEQNTDTSDCKCHRRISLKVSSKSLLRTCGLSCATKKDFRHGNMYKSLFVAGNNNRQHVLLWYKVAWLQQSHKTPSETPGAQCIQTSNFIPPVQLSNSISTSGASMPLSAFG